MTILFTKILYKLKSYVYALLQHYNAEAKTPYIYAYMPIYNYIYIYIYIYRGIHSRII